MQYRTDKRPAFYLAGISVRTTNADGQSSRDIGALWTRFMQHNIAASIPNALSPEVYTVYTDYAGDWMQPYTAWIGCQVSEGQKLPTGLSLLQVPESTYRIYTVKGRIPEAVAQAWRDIWQSNADRRYSADFDVYGAKAADMEDAEMEIYLSIRAEGQ